jgi:hypothetical protein
MGALHFGQWASFPIFSLSAFRLVLQCGQAKRIMKNGLGTRGCPRYGMIE